MADEEEQKPYKLSIIGSEEVRDNSRGFTGEAMAEYPSGDIYIGEFNNGVSYNFFIF